MAFQSVLILRRPVKPGLEGRGRRRGPGPGFAPPHSSFSALRQDSLSTLAPALDRDARDKPEHDAWERWV